MPRWRIIRTLLYKEFLRYRYNWGLLVVVVALLALSALVSVSARFKKLPGQAESSIRLCHMLFRPGTADEQWKKHLEAHPPSFEAKFEWRQYKPPLDIPWLPTETMAIQLVAPAGQTGTEDSDPPESWKARYWYADEDATGILPYRDWFVRESHAFLGSRPRLEEETSKGRLFASTAPLDRVPLIVTALVIFALYLLSFNLYITSTGEEREKRVLLGLLLTPASPVEVIAAKAIFYASASLCVSLAVVSMYQPRLLARPVLWHALIAGSVGYVAVGTVVVSVVRRQTTISTVSMLYLLATSIIMMLAQFLPLFNVLKVFLMEDYLYRALQQIIGERSSGWWVVIPNQLYLNVLHVNQVVLSALVVAWSAIAVWVFAKQGMAISRAR